MTHRTSLVLLSLIAMLLNGAVPNVPVPAVAEDGVAVFFSPSGGCLDACVAVIASAQATLDVQAYLLTTKEIAGPIKAAHDRGVKVRIVMDSDNAASSYSSATYFFNAGIPVRIDAEHKEAHNKVMIADGKTVLTGSFNFTKAADVENAENLLVIENHPKLAEAYIVNFEKHLAHAKPYAKPSN